MPDEIAQRSKTDSIRNIVIREEIGTNPLIRQTEKKQPEWFEHVLAMKENK